MPAGVSGLHHRPESAQTSGGPRVPPYHWWRTVFFLIPAISVYTIVLGAASIASSLVDRRGHFAHRCARAWSWLILKTTGVRVSVEGLERIRPGTTYIFVSNHQSIYDIPVIFASLDYQLRIIAKASLARFPMLGWHLKRGGHLFVDRKNPDRSGILARWRALVADGLSLIIFAEGTRSWDGQVGRFKAGSFLLAMEAGLPVVPLAVINTRSVMPKGRLRTEPADVKLIVHDPIPAPALAAPTARDARALAVAVHAIVAATVRARQPAA
jgi:1-acyl-sn-glycerol-3-phosphate acyltransferase